MEHSQTNTRHWEHKLAPIVSQAMEKEGYGWRSGQSGNPLGRPRTALVSATLRGFYTANPKELIRYIMVAHRMALKGNVKFWELICDRLEGKVPQAIDHTGTIHHSIDDNQRAEIDQMTAIMNVIDVEPTDIKPK